MANVIINLDKDEILKISKEAKKCDLSTAEFIKRVVFERFENECDTQLAMMSLNDENPEYLSDDETRKLFGL